MSGQFCSNFREIGFHCSSIFQPLPGDGDRFPRRFSFFAPPQRRIQHLSTLLHTAIIFYSTVKRDRPEKFTVQDWEKYLFTSLETQLGRHRFLYKLTRKVMICLLGSTNSKFISSCACFTCRISIPVKRNEPSLQEIPNKINH